MLWPLTPVEYSIISPLYDDFVAAFGPPNDLGFLHNVVIFGAASPSPYSDYGLLPPCLRFAHTVTSINARLGTGCRLNFTRLASQPTGLRKLSWRTWGLTPISPI